MNATNLLEADHATVGDRILWRGHRAGRLAGAGSAGVLVQWADGTRGLLPWHEVAADVDVLQD